MITTFRRIVLLTAIFTERWVLSLVFFYLAWTEFSKAQGIYLGQRPKETTVFIDVAHHYILFVLACLTGVFLLVARRPTVLPEKLRFVLAPLATTFFTLSYYTVPWFPQAWRMSFCPQQWQTTFVGIGLVCIMIGPLISLWGIA